MAIFYCSPTNAEASEWELFAQSSTAWQEFIDVPISVDGNFYEYYFTIKQIGGNYYGIFALISGGTQNGKMFWSFNDSGSLITSPVFSNLETAEYAVRIHSYNDDDVAADVKVYRKLKTDNTAPVINYTGVIDGGEYINAVNIVYEAIDVQLQSVTAEYRHDGGEEVPYVSGTPLTAYGEYTLTITAVDVAGNQSEVIITFSILPPDPVIEILEVTEATITVRDIQTYADAVKWQFIIEELTSGWITDAEYTFTQLSPNKRQLITIEVRKQ